MPHQVDVLRWSKHRSSAGMFLQMRLGKSLCASRWAESRPVRDPKVLITCPLSVVPSWRRECRAEGIDLVELTGTAAQRERKFLEAGDRHGWYAINYEGCIKAGGGRKPRPSAYAELPWDVVIVDESPRIRNPKAKTTRVFLGHLADAPHKVLLSGLPNPEGPEDFVAQMIFLHGEFMGHRSYWTWRQEHMNPVRHGWVVRGKSEGPIRAEVHRLNYFLTRKEAGLPDQMVRSTRWVQLPPAVRRATREAERDFELGGELTDSKLTVLTWLMRLAGGRHKDPALRHDEKLKELEYLASGEFRGQKLVVWARFTAEIVAAEEYLRDRGHRVVRVTGEVDHDERARRIDDWSSKSGPRILVGQPRCLQMGVDLSAADVEVFVSNYPDFEIRSQAADRIVHPRKTWPVLCVDIVAEDSVDEDTVESLVDKDATAKSYSRRFLGRAAEGIARRRVAA